MKITVDFSEKPNYSKEYLELHKKFNAPLSNLTAEQTGFHRNIKSEN